MIITILLTHFTKKIWRVLQSKYDTKELAKKKKKMLLFDISVIKIQMLDGICIMDSGNALFNLGWSQDHPDLKKKNSYIIIKIFLFIYL